MVKFLVHRLYYFLNLVFPQDYLDLAVPLIQYSPVSSLDPPYST